MLVRTIELRARESHLDTAFAPQVGLGDGRLTMFACETRRLLERHRMSRLLELRAELGAGPGPEPEPESQPQ